jgi:hypothetical protein
MHWLAEILPYGAGRPGMSRSGRLLRIDRGKRRSGTLEPSSLRPMEPLSALAPSDPKLAHLRVLVVDDNRDSGHLLKTFLEYCGAAVRLSGSATGPGGVRRPRLGDTPTPLPAAPRRGLQRTKQVRREREQRSGHRLGGAIARHEFFVGDPAGGARPRPAATATRRGRRRTPAVPRGRSYRRRPGPDSAPPSGGDAENLEHSAPGCHGKEVAQHG